MADYIRNLKTEILSDNWYTLKKATYEYRRKDGTWEIQEREAYDRGNGATVLLYNRQTRTVILTVQFRLPTYINGNPDGMLTETCAGIIDDEHPEESIRRESEGETGYRIGKVQKIMEAYMSPGSVTEMMHFYTAEYDSSMKISNGGGLESEQENISLLELPFEQAFSMIASGEIKDGKTVILLQYAKLNDTGISAVQQTACGYLSYNHEEVMPLLIQAEKSVREGKWAAGFLSYEAVKGIDSNFCCKTADKTDVPLIWFGIYNSPEVIPADSFRDLSASCPSATHPPPDLQSDTTQELYKQNIARIKDCIRAGDTYQINYTFRMRGVFLYPPFDFFCNIVRTDIPPYSAYIQTAQHA
ncbi:hypothetical protein CHS0354_030116, partial [Potamilus streckersoni]